MDCSFALRPDSAFSPASSALIGRPGEPSVMDHRQPKVAGDHGKLPAGSRGGELRRSPRESMRERDYAANFRKPLAKSRLFAVVSKFQSEGAKPQVPSRAFDSSSRPSGLRSHHGAGIPESRIDKSPANLSAEADAPHRPRSRKRSGSTPILWHS